MIVILVMIKLFIIEIKAGDVKERLINCHCRLNYIIVDCTYIKDIGCNCIHNKPCIIEVAGWKIPISALSLRACLVRMVPGLVPT